MKKKDSQLVMPFGDAFAEIWEIWKEYKWASHKFKYKSVFSEQAALEQVVTLSRGDEEIAIKIIKQSMRREWQGLFPLHETTTGNGKSTKSKQSGSESGNQPPASNAEKFKREFMQRNGNGKQSGDSDYLKAV